MRVAYRVQHARGRDGTLQRLLPLLPPETQVVTDERSDDPNPLRGYLACLADPPADATHLLVIQDDALPCRDFAARVGEAVLERPDGILSLFVGGLPGRTRRDFLQTLARGERWTPIWFRSIHHVVCMVWPVAEAAAFAKWLETARWPSRQVPRSDDAAVGFWARTDRPRRTVWAHVPCLVEHPDDVPSTIRRQQRGGDRGRKAIAWIDTPGV